MPQAVLLESISESNYLSADNYRVYRTIMCIFYLEHQKMHCQMDRDAALLLLREQALFAQYTPEQLTVTLENLSIRTSGLSASPFHRIREDLYKAEQLDDLPLREVNAWWQDLQEDFQRLSQNHQDFLREFYGPGMEMQMKSVDFICYKQNRVRYLEEFIQNLQHSAAQISTQLEAFSRKQITHTLELVQRSEREIPCPQSEQSPNWETELRARNQGV